MLCIDSHWLILLFLNLEFFSELNTSECADIPNNFTLSVALLTKWRMRDSYPCVRSGASREYCRETETPVDLHINNDQYT